MASMLELRSLMDAVANAESVCIRLVLSTLLKPVALATADAKVAVSEVNAIPEPTH